MLFVPPDLDLELCNGIWSRNQLEEMDSRFRAAVEAAFSKGLESRAAASATVRIGRTTYATNGMNAKPHTETVIESAWCWLRENMAAGKDVLASEVVARCPGVDPRKVRSGLKRRLMEAKGVSAKESVG